MQYRNWHKLGSGRMVNRPITSYHTGAQCGPDQYVTIDFGNEGGKHLIVEMTCDEVRDLIRRLHQRLEWIDEAGD